MDTLIGVLIEVIGALVLIAATAFGLAHTSASGNYADLGTTMRALQQHAGHGVGALLALVLLDGSLIGANLTALTLGYTLGDVSGRMRHSLHCKPRQAPGTPHVVAHAQDRHPPAPLPRSRTLDRPAHPPRIHRLRDRHRRPCTEPAISPFPLLVVNLSSGGGDTIPL